MNKSNIKHKMYSLMIQKLKDVVSVNHYSDATVADSAKEIIIELEKLRENV